MDSKEALKMACAIAIPNVGGIAGSHLTRRNLKTWFHTLKRPSFQPPDKLFAPVWCALYCGMGYASYLVWRDGGGFSGNAKLPLVLYGSQLALNWAWTPIFFGAHKIKYGAIEIIALTLTAGACGVSFFGVNKVAGYLFIPYFAWLTYASALNLAICKLNPEDGEKKKE